MDLGLKGLRAVVTGGTKGIGRAAADIFAQEGASVAICARNADEVKTAVKDLTAKGVQAYGADINVADKAALQKFIADSAQALGGIDILVANVSALAAQDIEEVLEPGVRRRHDAHRQRRQRRPALPRKIKTSLDRHRFLGVWPRGRFYRPGLWRDEGGAYSLRAETRPSARGEDDPGEFGLAGQHVFRGRLLAGRRRTNLPDIFKMALALNPTGRMAKPEEIGRGIVFLASPASSFTTRNQSGDRRSFDARRAALARGALRQSESVDEKFAAAPCCRRTPRVGRSFTKNINSKK